MEKGNRIREIRKERKMTLSDLSGKVGVSIAYLSDIERGNRPGGDDTMARIARALDAPELIRKEVS